jgi:hypothetical protein
MSIWEMFGFVFLLGKDKDSRVGAGNYSQAVGFLECKFLCIYFLGGMNSLQY